VNTITTATLTSALSIGMMFLPYCFAIMNDLDNLIFDAGQTACSEAPEMKL
jgi:hypothetical protein